MLTVCKFDKKKDLQEVDQFGFVDLVKSSSEGFVPNDLGSTAESFDGIDIDPESILGKPSDKFEAMRLQESLAKGISDDMKKKSSKTENE